MAFDRFSNLINKGVIKKTKTENAFFQCDLYYLCLFIRLPLVLYLYQNI